MFGNNFIYSKNVQNTSVIVAEDREIAEAKTLRAEVFDGLTLEELTDKFTDYFETFDYVLGDYSYGKLRLKGFYNKNNKELQEYNDYEKVHEYLKEYCSYNCGYYVIKKL